MPGKRTKEQSRILAAKQRAKNKASWEGRDPYAEREESFCNYCTKVKPVTHFTKDLRRRSGVRASCRLCDSAQHRLRKYGVTQRWMNLHLFIQDCACSICGIDIAITSCVVDHDHTTGRIRSLLCSPCNTGIGLLRENKEILLSAVDYLDKHAITVSTH